MLNLVDGMVLYHRADAFCISRLLPDRLENQYCFRTERALECLEFMESEKVWKN